VAFWSFASDLVPGDGNSRSDVFVRDLVAGTTVRASVNTEGGDPGHNSLAPSINWGGRYVAFESEAANLVPDDASLHPDVFVRRMS
jgi:hypothetical protein